MATNVGTTDARPVVLERRVPLPSVQCCAECAADLYELKLMQVGRAQAVFRRSGSEDVQFVRARNSAIWKLLTPTIEQQQRLFLRGQATV